jgi:hypothetical protein
MRGHTSSVKTVTFFDPSRSHLDPSIASSIVASAGRDGNILLFDLRCQGRQSAADSPLPLTRPSYSNGVDGFCAQKDTQILEPVMTIRGAHGEGSRKTTPNHHVRPAVWNTTATKLMISERLCDQSPALWLYSRCLGCWHPEVHTMGKLLFSSPRLELISVSSSYGICDSRLQKRKHPNHPRWHGESCPILQRTAPIHLVVLDQSTL